MKVLNELYTVSINDFCCKTNVLKCSDLCSCCGWFSSNQCWPLATVSILCLCRLNVSWWVMTIITTIIGNTQGDTFHTVKIRVAYLTGQLFCTSRQIQQITSGWSQLAVLNIAFLFWFNFSPHARAGSSLQPAKALTWNEICVAITALNLWPAARYIFSNSSTVHIYWDVIGCVFFFFLSNYCIK